MNGSTTSCGMSANEWTVLCKALRSAYPAHTVLPDEYSVKLWYSILKDIPYEVCNMAVQKCIMESHFPPSVAQIRTTAAELTETPVKTWSEAWEEVISAVHRYGYANEGEAINSMAELTQKCVKQIGWQNICLSEKPSVERASFRDIYANLMERKKKTDALPSSFKERMMLISGGAYGQIGVNE